MTPPLFIETHPWVVYDKHGDFDGRFSSREGAEDVIVARGVRAQCYLAAPNGQHYSYEVCVVRWQLRRLR